MGLSLHELPAYVFDPQLDDSVEWGVYEGFCVSHGDYVAVVRLDKPDHFCPKCVITDRNISVGLAEVRHG